MNKFLLQLLVTIAALLLVHSAGMANGLADFSVRESRQEGNAIELVALDASGNRLDKFSGGIPFSVNGFETEMKFKGGRAFFPRDVAASTFLYLKYKGEPRDLTRLYYVYQGLAGGFTVMHIPLVMLVVIPVGLILLGMIFRRLIILMLVLLAAFFYFNSTKGLSPGAFLEVVGDWINNLLQMIMGT